MRLSINKNESAVLVTLIVVIFLASAYFFIYIPSNEKRVQEQRFRSLQNLDLNIHSKIQNSVSLINNLLTAYSRQVNNVEERDYLRKYMVSYPQDNFILTPLVSQPINSTNRDSLTKLDSTYTIDVDNVSQRINLEFRKIIKLKNDTSLYKIGVLFTYEQFIKSLLPQNVFDEYIVFSNEEVIYQTFPSGISKIVADSVVQIKSGIAGSGVKNLTVSGKDFKMFLQPINFSSNKNWVVAGLLSNKRYQVEKNQLPGRVVLLLVTVVLIIIVAFPWIKLYQMGSKDRLTIVDGAAVISVSMLLMSLMSFIFFKYGPTILNTDTVSSKDALATEIKDAFEKEIATAFNKLSAIDSLRMRDSSFRNTGDVINLGKPNISFRNNTRKPVLNEVNKIIGDLSVKQIFWLNENGNEITNFITDSMNAAHGNYKNREYFKRIINKKEYLLKDDNNSKFFIDQVVSWSSGRFVTVLSKLSSDTVGGKKVVVVSFTMKSVRKPILPAGYHFAIVNNSGKVLYHSDESKNLNENLLNEFTESNQLTSCLEGRFEGVFKTNYFSQEYNVKIQPLKNLPYFIVIFGDTNHKETRDIEIYSFTLSMMLLLFGFLVLQLFVIFLVSSKRSFFKNQLFTTSWIGPKVSSHHQYNVAIITNAAIIILLIIFFHITTFLTYLFILLFSVTFISGFLNSVFLRRYKKTSPTNFQFKRVAIYWLLVLIIAINILALINLYYVNYLIFFGYEIIAIGIGSFVYIKGDSITHSINKRTKKIRNFSWSYTRSFSLMALSRLIITSGIPIMFFYISSYNYEQNISIRYHHLQYANALIDNLTNDQLQDLSNKNFKVDGIYQDGEWIKSVSLSNKHHQSIYTKEDDLTIQVLSMFRLFITTTAINENKFYNQKASDSSFYHNHLLHEASAKNGSTITYKETSVPGKYLVLSSSGLNYSLPSLLKGTGFVNAFSYWGLLSLLMIVFFFLIYNIIHKLFALNLPDLTLWKALDYKILSNKNLNNLLFVIGLPGSGKLSLILEKIRSKEIVQDNGEAFIYDKYYGEGSNVFIADLINIPDSGDARESDEQWLTYIGNLFKDQNRLVIVNHFEYNIQDAVTNRIKLNLLEKIMQQNKCKLIILSTIHPVAFLDSITDHTITAADKNIPGQDLERWHVLLGHYRIVVIPIEETTIPRTADAWQQPIYNETRTSHFLNKIQSCAIEVANSLPEESRLAKSDELALNYR